MSGRHRRGHLWRLESAVGWGLNVDALMSMRSTPP